MSEAAPAATPDAGGGAPPGAPPASPAAAPFALPERFASHPVLPKLTSVEELADMYVGAEKLLGVPKDQLIRLPKGPDDKDGWADYRAKLGVPETPDKYDFTPVKDAPPVSEPSIAAFRTMMHKANVPLAMQKELWAGFNAQQVAMQQEQMQAAQNARAAGEAALKAEFGPAYESKLKDASALLNLHDEKGELYEFMEETGLGSDPRFVKFLTKLAGNFTDDHLREGRSQSFETARGDPRAAAAALAAFDADPANRKALMDASDPNHAAAIERRTQLILAAAPKGA